MFEFAFFDRRTRQRFVAYLNRTGVPATEIDDGDALGVGIPEDTDDRLLEDIEASYARMLEHDRALVEAAADPERRQAAGVVVNLASGQTVYARVDPQLLGRIMEVLSAEELGEVVNAIVDAVERPDARPLCHPAGPPDPG